MKTLLFLSSNHSKNKYVMKDKYIFKYDEIKSRFGLILAAPS